MLDTLARAWPIYLACFGPLRTSMRKKIHTKNHVQTYVKFKKKTFLRVKLSQVKSRPIEEVDNGGDL